MDISDVASLDFETGSLADLKKIGAAKYAEDPTTRVLCFSYQLPGDPGPKNWREGERLPQVLLDWVASGGTVSGWNVTFEWHIWNKVLRCFPNAVVPVLKPEQLVDTMAVAACNGLPLGLDMCAKALPKLRVQKDADGHALMLRMSRPRKVHADGTLDWWHEQDPAKYDRLVAYCDQDVIAERKILAGLTPMRAPERAVWQMDFAMMQRGVLLDFDLLDRMNVLAGQENARLDAKMRNLTNGMVPSTRAVGQLLNYVQMDHPNIKSLAKDQLAFWIDKLGDAAPMTRLLRVRQEAARSSVAKLAAMENFASLRDRRMRGLTQYGGAMRTLRWCLPAETPVLVRDRKGVREVPIVEVTQAMRVWDGTAWVAHEGVVFSGYHPVISHDGVVATTEHRVYVSDTESVTLAEAKATDRRLWHGVGDIPTDFPEWRDLHRADQSGVPSAMAAACECGQAWAHASPTLGESDTAARPEEFCVGRDGHFADTGTGCGVRNCADRGTEPAIQRQPRGRVRFGKRDARSREVAGGEPRGLLETSVSGFADGFAGCGCVGETRPPLFEMGRSPLDQIGESILGKIEHQEKPAGGRALGDTGSVGSLRQHCQGTKGPTRGHDARGTGRTDGEGSRGDCSLGRGEGRAARGDQAVLGGNEGRPGEVCGTESPQERVSESRPVPTYDIVNAGPRNRFMAWGRIVSNSGRGPQVQNYPRSAVKDQDALVSYILGGGDAGGFKVFFGVDPLTALASALRGCLTVPKGKVFGALDFSQIEARVLPWLAYDDVLLDVFRSGKDIYVVAASDIYLIREEDVDGDKRQVGKVSVLALGFGGGVGAFQTMAKNYGLVIPDEQAEEIKVAWRLANKKIVAFWYDLERAAIAAINSPGAFRMAGRCSFRMERNDLLMGLPSRRDIVYRDAELGVGTFGNECVTYMGVDQYTNQWKRLDTYGGKLAENATQACARDVMASAMLRLHRAGVPLIGSVHDEVLMELDDVGDFARAKAIFETVPAWAAGLPIAADGYVGQRFRKG